MTALSYLTHKDRIETALRYLESHGLPVGPLWTEHDARIRALNTAEATDLDRKYELPVDRPTIPEHFLNGRPQVLDASHAWPGYSYSLSPGQRDWLRSNYGLTPTMTVTLITITRWPGTRHPQMMHLRSDIHIDPRHRKHVLVDAVIREPGRFFTESAARDAEIAAEKLKEAESKPEKAAKARATKHLASVDDYLNDLEAAVADI